MKFFAVYLQSIQDDETLTIELLNAFINWYKPGKSFTFVLDIVGAYFLGQPRPVEFVDDDESYRQLLVGRSIARVSDGTEGSVNLLLDYLTSINGPGTYNVWSGPLEHWTIQFFNLQLTTIWKTLYVTLIFDAIGATDSFTVTLDNGGAALYDDESQGYDVGLYL